MKATVNMMGWQGGQSADDTRGPTGSFAYGRGLNFRSSPSVLQLVPQTVENSGGVVTDLILDMVLTPSGDIYSVGNSGNFYRRLTSDGSWTLVASLGEVPGGSLVYRSDQDAILIPLQTRVASYAPISSSPTIAVAKYAQSVSTDTASSSSGGAQTYTLTTAISETSTALRSFTPDIEPFYSIKVNVIAKGTGDWTLTLHDDANTSLGTSTITTANLTSNTSTEFVFSSLIRALVKPNARTYHFHLTSTVADGTVACSKLEDLSTADYQVSANRFVTTANTLHPAVQFLQYTCYGNERYLSTHEPLENTPTNAEWLRHRLTFPSGYEVCGLALSRESLAIACERQVTSSNSIEYQHGIIFFWNGIDTTYSQAIPIPEGSPRSLFSYENELYWNADGSWYKLVGEKPQRVRRFPGATDELTGVYASTTVNPNMATVRHGVLLSGFPSSSSNTGLEYGVYSLGSLDRTYDPSFGLDYSLSSGSRFNTGKNLKIGCVKNFGAELYISWRDDSNPGANFYGVDVIGPLSTAATSARIELLWFDAGEPARDQLAERMKIVFKALPSGSTVTPIWRTARGGSWNNEGGAVQAVAGDTSVTLSIDQRTPEIQLGAIITSTGSNVQLRTISFQYDNLHAYRRPPEEDL